MKCQTIHQIDCMPECDEKLVTILDSGKHVILAGTVIDQAECPTANCVHLVRNGLAISMDEECHQAAQRTEKQLAAAQIAMKELLMLPTGKHDLDEDDEDDHDEEEDE